MQASPCRPCPTSGGPTCWFVARPHKPSQRLQTVLCPRHDLFVRLATLLIVLLAACPRPVFPEGAQQVLLPAGALCDRADQCESGDCETVCCNRVCSVEESCARPAALGRCTLRERGDPCTDTAQCG